LILVLISTSVFAYPTNCRKQHDGQIECDVYLPESSSICSDAGVIAGNTGNSCAIEVSTCHILLKSDECTNKEYASEVASEIADRLIIYSSEYTYSYGALTFMSGYWLGYK